jgi:internalin A
MTTEAQKPLRVFCSYSRKDEKYLNELRTWLRGLERQRLIEWWHDREIVPGQEWREAIDENLEAADVILLLISPDFMASDFAYKEEMQRAICRHERGEARRWKTGFERFQEAGRRPRGRSGTTRPG